MQEKKLIYFYDQIKLHVKYVKMKIVSKYLVNSAEHKRKSINMKIKLLCLNKRIYIFNF